MKKKTYRSLGVSDTPCPRCGELAEAREHLEIKDKQLKQPFYFTKWFNCTNNTCQTTIFMKDEFKVFNPNSDGDQWKIAGETLEDYNLFKEELHDKLKSLGL